MGTMQTTRAPGLRATGNGTVTRKAMTRRP
jgi:hypothetical protein